MSKNDTGNESAPPLERGVRIAAGVVALGAIMTILDTTIISVAIRTLSTAFGTTLPTIQWVSTGYMLGLVAVIPLTGWAAERFGGKRLWMCSLVLFMVGSLLCGLAWSVGSLIAFRVIQGVGGGMVLPAGQALLAGMAGRERMGRVMSLVGVPLMLGPIFGPVLGGALIDLGSWRWIFFVNVPIALVALPLSWRLLRPASPRPSERVDLLGLCLLAPGLALLVYGLSSVVSSGGASASVLVGLLGAAVLLVAFVVVALRVERPLLDLRLFSDRTFTAANLVTVLTGAAMIGAMFLLPLYYQTVRGDSVLVGGLMTAPQGLGAAIAMPIGGRLVDRGRAGRSVLCGAALMALGYVPFVLQSPGSSILGLGAALFVVGVGAGLTITPAMSTAYRTLQRDAIPRATALLSVLQRTGGLLGTALLAVVLDAEITAHVPARQGGAGVLRAIPAGLRTVVPPELSAAFGAAFWLPLALAVVALLPALLLPRGQQADRAGREPVQLQDSPA
jgi:EmrB/QacA subfamily drug resistance transporter